MARTSVSKGFGKAVRQHRLEAAMTQEQLAEAARVHPTYVSMVERGIKSPTLEVADRIACGLSIPLPQLLEKAPK